LFSQPRLNLSKLLGITFKHCWPSEIFNTVPLDKFILCECDFSNRFGCVYGDRTITSSAQGQPSRNYELNGDKAVRNNTFAVVVIYLQHRVSSLMLAPAIVAFGALFIAAYVETPAAQESTDSRIHPK